MKKLLLAIPLVAGASWAVASYYSGSQSRSAYDQLLGQLNEMQPFTLANETYSAGFLQSHAVTKVMDSAAADAQVLFRLQHFIDHSPVSVIDSNVRFGAANIQTSLVQDASLPEPARDFIQGFDDVEPFQINTQIGFDGDAESQLSVSAYHQQADGVDVSFGGFDYRAVMQGDTIKGSGDIRALMIDRNGKLLALAPGTINTDLTRLSQAVYTGSHGVQFDNLTVSSNVGMSLDLTLESIGMTSDTSISNDQLASRASVRIGKIDSPLPLTSASIDVGVSNLSVTGINQSVETVDQLMNSDSMLSFDPGISKKLLSAFLPVIGPGAGVDYTIEFSNDGGNASLTGGVSIIEESSPHYPAGGLGTVATVRDLLNVLQLEAHLNADADAIDQTPLAMLMMSPQAQEVIVADGTSYKADITLSELIMDINGDPLSLETMLGEMLDMPLADLTQM